MESSEDHDALVSHFCSITGAGLQDAHDYLGSSEWDLDRAMAEYYTAQEEAQDQRQSVEPVASATPSTGPRTLGGDNVSSRPVPASSIGPSRPATQKKFGTLQDLQGAGGAGAGHEHAHGSEDDSDEEQDFYAGGEKSGLAVENPNSGPRSGADHIRNIIAQARRNAPRPDGEDPVPASTRFSGAGQTLGGDGIPSQTVADRDGSAPRALPRVQRTLHLWRDGFSVDDGDLFRYDDPANAGVLGMINQGRAPLHLLNVEPGQEVDVNVMPHKDQDFVPPKKKFKPFAGSGQRLGSPTPNIISSSTQRTQRTGTTEPASSSAPSTSSPSVDVDDSQPTLQLQIRLGDGTRLQSRFNTTHTIGDVYSFVNAANPTSAQRAYALMTTFPSKELSDKSAVLGDMAEFKRGGVVVQKWQ